MNELVFLSRITLSDLEELEGRVGVLGHLGGDAGVAHDFLRRAPCCEPGFLVGNVVGGHSTDRAGRVRGS